MLIDLIAGARPNFMKVAPIIRALEARAAVIMTRYEPLLQEAPARLCLVVGDVTSTMACAIAAQKLCIPVAHVEGGIRSGDWTMPEEINRMVTDSITNWFITTSEFANANLPRAGVAEERIFFVGNTIAVSGVQLSGQAC